MSTVRLSFLYPHLFRAARLAESVSPSAAQTTKTRYRKPNCRSRPQHANHHSSTFATSARARQAALFERHGTAVEPIPVSPGAVKLPQPEKTTSQPPSQSRDPTSSKIQDAAQEKTPEREAERAERPNETDIPAHDAASDANSTEGQVTTKPAAQTPQQVASEERMQHSGPMEAVLHMPPPEAMQHPHISKPTYIHHFDTYTLVKRLEEGGYTQLQSITVMKAVRALLAQNLDVAQEGLVSKSDVDNETYLFRAACSELSSEVVNNRKAADEHTRQQRTHLQHEIDILTQRMSQDIMTLKDDVKGLFNDRRMNVREEQRNMESAIQQINLKISVTLNSDSRSEIEGLRWVLIRRSVLGIIFMAVLTLGSLRYATYVGHERQRKQKEAEAQAEEVKRNSGKEDRAPPVDAAEILAAN
ncbi:hypothetical protein F5Y18DRAFT_379815 [Xylariaceae sp. FL1019]|nr:hypothetical protein F5Y18DRAFT_379815 [Xylariaceae sp. FL1019]